MPWLRYFAANFGAALMQSAPAPPHCRRECPCLPLEAKIRGDHGHPKIQGANIPRSSKYSFPPGIKRCRNHATEDGNPRPSLGLGEVECSHRQSQPKPPKPPAETMSGSGLNMGRERIYQSESFKQMVWGIILWHSLAEVLSGSFYP